MRDFVVVLDPGVEKRRSSIALAETVRVELLRRPGIHVLLTSERYEHARVEHARESEADVFLSIDSSADAYGGARASRTYVFENQRGVSTETRGSRSSLALARCIAHELRAGAAIGSPEEAEVLGRPIPVLDPRAHHARTAACLVDIGTLAPKAIRGGAAAPTLAVRLANGVDEHLAELIRPTLPRATPGMTEENEEEPFEELSISSEVFDIWHEVPLVPQLTGMSCWAAAAAMIVGWRDRIHVEPEEIARGAGRWEAYRDGLEPVDLPTLAEKWGLQMEKAETFSVDDLARLLLDNGPLWVGEASPGLHSIVVAGMRGDRSLDGTMVRVADPWPEGRGERYSLPFRQFLANFRAAAMLDGVEAQILHAGGRGSGSSRRVRIEERFEMRSDRTRKPISDSDDQTSFSKQRGMP